MGTRYRVDRVEAHELRPPVGMNSLLYLGNDRRAALKEFNSANTGLTEWGVPNPTYGVAMYEWSDSLKEYKRLGFRG